MGGNRQIAQFSARTHLTEIPEIDRDCQRETKGRGCRKPVGRGKPVAHRRRGGVAMYHRLRTWHRWIGLACSAALLIISATGFLLAMKGRLDWVRPPEMTGTAPDAVSSVVGVETAMEAAFAQGIPDLSSPADVDRVDYRPKRNVYKVVSRRGYHEVQVDGADGRVLQVARRNDQFIEDLHDLSFFGDSVHAWVLPAVGVGLLGLSLSGVAIFTVPVVRRMRYRRSRQTTTDR